MLAMTALFRVAETAIKLWKTLTGYHRRSLVETTMFRLKKFFGAELKNRIFTHQQVESYLRCSLINHFTGIGMPSYMKH